MESDPNPFPKIDLFPKVTKVAHFLLDHIRSEGLSDHHSEPVPDTEQRQFDFEAQADKGW